MSAQRILIAASAAIGCFFLAGCGSTGTTQATQDCPAAKPINGHADIAGLQLGMSVADVKALLSCRDKGFRFRTPRFGFSLPSMPDGKSSTTALLAQRGKIAGCDPADPATLATCTDEDPTFEHVDETIKIYFTGLPGVEKAIAIKREIDFRSEDRRDAAPIIADLAAKYGPNPGHDYFGSPTRLAWVFDSRGQRISTANEDFAACRDAVAFGERSSLQLRHGCRLTITAWVQTGSGDFAEGYGVNLVDQDAANAAIDDAAAKIIAAGVAAEKQKSQQTALKSGRTSL